MEKELRRLSKMSPDHERTLRKAVEKAVADYPDSEEGKNFLEAFWASKLDKYKKSEDFQKEVAQVAFPFVGYGFNACKEQFLTHMPPPAGEEFFWTCRLPMPMLQTPLPKLLLPRRRILLKTRVSLSAFCLLGEVEAEVKQHPPAATIEPSEGGASGEGKTEEEKEDAPTGPQKAPSMTLLLQPLCQRMLLLLLLLQALRTLKTPLVGKKFEKC
ncbi:UNVERIFIED_CONTAM: hypothetical protein Sradi_4301100 [Sesamum radiatum]|uniref:Uncharacterized protein n=1 Tax=Sesamum radiatum TaxID=300843 RepID=A0AAW2NMR3_SESRA